MSDPFGPWRKHLVPIECVRTEPPEWVVPQLLVPGLNLLTGDPKTYKSFLVMHIAAAITQLKPVAGHAAMVPAKKGSLVYWAPEQSHGRIRHIYEARVLKRKLANKTLQDKSITWDFILVKEPWEWLIDEPKADRDIAAFLNEAKPTVAVIDPLRYFHNMDENDPRMVRPLVPIRQAVLSYGGALILVHHNKKPSGGDNGRGDPNPWNRARGTSALWAMADSGTMTTRLQSGGINVTQEFKDFPGRTWTWRPDHGDKSAPAALGTGKGKS